MDCCCCRRLQHPTTPPLLPPTSLPQAGCTCTAAVRCLRVCPPATSAPSTWTTTRGERRCLCCRCRCYLCPPSASAASATSSASSPAARVLPDSSTLPPACNPPPAACLVSVLGRQHRTLSSLHSVFYQPLRLSAPFHPARRHLWDSNVLDIRRCPPNGHPTGAHVHKHSEWCLHQYRSRFPRPLVRRVLGFTVGIPAWLASPRSQRSRFGWGSQQAGKARPSFQKHHLNCSINRTDLLLPLLPLPEQAAREYQYARRVWHRPADGGAYVLCRGLPLPDAGERAATGCCRRCGVPLGACWVLALLGAAGPGSASMPAVLWPAPTPCT